MQPTLAWTKFGVIRVQTRYFPIHFQYFWSKHQSFQDNKNIIHGNIFQKPKYNIVPWILNSKVVIQKFKDVAWGLSFQKILSIMIVRGVKKVKLLKRYFLCFFFYFKYDLQVSKIDVVQESIVFLPLIIRNVI